MRIIKQREVIESVEYRRSFVRANSRGSGFAFECNSSGVVDVEGMNPAARANYELCLTGFDPDSGAALIDEGIITYHNRFVSPKVGECEDCGAEVSLGNFTNTCQCGADYNMSGCLLAPRECWGEETGESVSDILNA